MNKQMIRRPKQVPAPIRHHLLQQQQSKQTIQAYCQKTGLIAATFYGWRNRYGKQVFTEIKTKHSPTEVSFTSLGVLKPQRQSLALCEIHFPCGTAVTVYPGASTGSYTIFKPAANG